MPTDDTPTLAIAPRPADRSTAWDAWRTMLSDEHQRQALLRGRVDEIEPLLGVISELTELGRVRDEVMAEEEGLSAALTRRSNLAVRVTETRLKTYLALLEKLLPNARHVTLEDEDGEVELPELKLTLHRGGKAS